jgi:hypothetical protein
MKPSSVTLVVIGTVLIGLTAFLGGRAFHRASHGEARTRGAQAEIHWMRKEFALSDAAFEKVESLHLAYVPRCDELCMAVSESGRKVAELAAATPAMTEAIADAIAEDERVRGECRKALLGHLYETAAAMPPEAGKRFLEMALPTVLSPSHPDVHDSVRH